MTFLEDEMLNIHVEKIGEMAVVDCEGRMEQGEDSFRLREAVTSQHDVETIVVDLSEVTAIEGSSIHISFRGKSGRHHETDINDRRLARIVKDCRDLPGYELFQYLDDEGERHTVGSAEVKMFKKSPPVQQLPPSP